MILFIKKKYAYQSLKKIYGINTQTIKKIIGIVGLQPNTLCLQLEQKRVSNQINELLFNMRIEFKLRLITFSRIILLIYTKSYRGMRHLQGLPCRGQRTHANGKTPKTLKTLGKNIPFRFKKKATTILEKKNPKGKKQIKKKLKLSKKQKGKLKAKQKMQKKKK